MLDFQDIPTDAIHGIEAPTMVMCGDADIVRPEHAVEMFRALPHAQLAILPATNHMTFVKSAEPAAGMILPFSTRQSRVTSCPEDAVKRPASAPCSYRPGRSF